MHRPDTPQTRPRLRGVLHTYSFVASVAAGVVLVITTAGWPTRLAAAVYATSLAGLFGASALYHRVTWSPAARRWLRRLDHSMIFVLIAGTFTPFAVVLGGEQAPALLARVWGATSVAVVVKLVWIQGPKWVSVVLALVLGWVVAGSAPDLALRAGPAAGALVVGGGLLYTVGALAYAFRWPRRSAADFGYHEVFHACVSAAALAHFLSIAFFVIPRG
jgi:hemolysin III